MQRRLYLLQNLWYCSKKCEKLLAIIIDKIVFAIVNTRLHIISMLLKLRRNKIN